MIGRDIGGGTPAHKITCFEDLIIWQKAVDLAKDIYLLTGRVEFKTDFGLKDQMRRAAVSISTNIAEGFERRSRKEYLNFLNIAKGSCGELRSLLVIANEVGYLADGDFAEYRERARLISGSIANHIKAISRVPDAGR
jgi:four helix bundle protein